MAGSCEKHGPQDDWSGVCRNVGDALKEGRSVGFNWGVDDGFYLAFCDECQTLTLNGEKRVHDLVPLCKGCFAEARLLNGNPEALQ